MATARRGQGVVLVVLLLIFGAVALRKQQTRAARRARTVATAPRELPDAPVRRVMDSVALLRDPERFENYLRQVYDESNVDMRFLIVRSVEGSIEEYGRTAARHLGLGSGSGRRGLLFVYDAGGNRLRIEVGPRLEGIITDHFAGYLMHEHVRQFASGGDLRMGFRLMLFIVQRRIREAVLGDEYDPRAVDFVREPHRLATGARQRASRAPAPRCSATARRTPP